MTQSLLQETVTKQEANVAETADTNKSVQQSSLKMEPTLTKDGEDVISISSESSASTLGAEEQLQEKVQNKTEELSVDIKTSKKTGAGKRWSQAEDKNLKQLVKTYGSRKWKLIAREFGKLPEMPQRTDVQCLHRWNKCLKPGLIKGSWSSEEDEVIRQKIQLERPNSIRWCVIADSLPGRLGKQVRERWINHLDPTISKREWTPEEDERLYNLRKQHGNRWKLIAQFLQGRSENGVKNRWHSIKPSLQKRMKHWEILKQKKVAKAEQQPPSTILNPHVPTVIQTMKTAQGSLLKNDQLQICATSPSCQPVSQPMIFQIVGGPKSNFVPQGYSAPYTQNMQSTYASNVQIPTPPPSSSNLGFVVQPQQTSNAVVQNQVYHHNNPSMFSQFQTGMVNSTQKHIDRATTQQPPLQHQQIAFVVPQQTVQIGNQHYAVVQPNMIQHQAVQAIPACSQAPLMTNQMVMNVPQ